MPVGMDNICGNFHCTRPVQKKLWLHPYYF